MFKTHIEEAIDICLHFITKEEIDIYSEHIGNVFDTLSIPKLVISPERIINSAAKKKNFTISNTLLSYNQNKSFTENLTIWGNKIRKQIADNDFKVSFDFSGNALSTYSFAEYKPTLDEETTSSFIEALKKDNIQRKYIFEQFVAIKELDFYYHINKSILNAEYLILDNYSKLLTNAIEKSISYSEEESTTIPFFCKKFLTLAQNMLGLCWRIRNAIKEENLRRIEFDSHSEELAEWRFPSKKSTYKTDISEYLFDFTTSVIEMTTIDHINKASSKNIESLLTLWKRKENILRWKFGSSHEDFESMIKMVEAKNASLLFKMVYDINEEQRDLIGLQNDNFFFTYGEKNDQEMKEAIEKVIMPKELNPIIRYKTKYKDKTIKLDDFKNKTIGFSTTTLPTDIQDYNKWITKGQTYYVEMSSVIEAVKKQHNLKSLEYVSNFISKIKTEQLTPYFFFYSLEFVKELLNSNTDIDIKHNLASLLNEILVKLKDYVLIFKNSMPPCFRPCFEHSFYQYDNQKQLKYRNIDNPNSILDYDYNDFKNSFFFASYCCSPISINRLEEKLQAYTLYYNSTINNITQELKNTQQTLLKQQQGLDTTTKNIEKHQHNSIQVLGLFTAFLSFIVTTVATFRVVTNLQEYIIYSLTYTLAITLFSFLISDHTKHNAKNNWVKYIIYLITCVCLFFFAKNYYNKVFPNLKKETKDESDTNNSSTLDNTVNLKDITPPDDTNTLKTQPKPTTTPD